MEPPWVLISRFYLQVELQILNLSAQKPLPSRNSLNTEKYPTRRQRSEETQMLKEKKDLQSILYSTLKSISKLLRHFCTRRTPISQVVTHQGSKELH